jgi:hypothetical protein
MDGEELEILQRFVAWFIWRCRNGGIRSRWTRKVAETIAEHYEIDVNSYEFNENSYGDFRPKGLFPND